MSGPVGDSTQDVELNLAPIIDCFTVLITYLLVTASFLSLAAVDVGVSATNSSAAPAASTDNKPPPWTLSIELKGGGEMEIMVKGGPDSKKFSYVIPPKTGGWDIASLTERLKTIQGSWPSITDASVTANPEVLYKDIVNVLHEIQTTMPKVYISG